MRNLYQTEPSSTLSAATNKKKRILGIGVDTVMDYPDGGGSKEGRHQQQQQQQQQQSQQYSQQSRSSSYFPHSSSSSAAAATSQEARQPPHGAASLYGSSLSQVQQPHHTSIYGQPPLNPNAYSANPYDMNMAVASQQSMEHEYLQQQQQFLQQQQRQQQQPVGYHHSPYPNTRNYAAAMQQQQQMTYQQQLALQQQYAAGVYGGAAPMDLTSSMAPQHMLPPQMAPHHAPPQQQQQHSYLQPKTGRLPADRPLIKLSVSLIDTYKHINTIYYEERDARRAARAKDKKKSAQQLQQQQHEQSQQQQITAPQGQGTNNNGWDDENYDYIITPGELFYGRYMIKERIGKGSFGQVVRADDTHENREVAIKIIKSKKPFLMQAKTEIELLSHLKEKDPEDQHNIVRLITHFMHRNHQCLVFEMLSLNLYELLKNTQFGGVSLNLIRKFAKQVLKSLSFLSRSDVDIIHCDLKPENILLRHPKKSGIKVIDFGSSCRSNKRMYSYIQSRFYRSPEVMLGLPYTTSIDMWSLGCILAEMHTGEPLFSGSDQFDQMQKIVKTLGMVPSHMLDKANDQHRLQFFEQIMNRNTGREEWVIRQQPSSTASRSGSTGGTTIPSTAATAESKVVIPSVDPLVTLTELIQGETGSRKKKYPASETGNSPMNYSLFVDLVHKMLAYDPRQRIKPEDALNHPFITEQYK